MQKGKQNEISNEIIFLFRNQKHKDVNCNISQGIFAGSSLYLENSTIKTSRLVTGFSNHSIKKNPKNQKKKKKKAKTKKQCFKKKHTHTNPFAFVNNYYCQGVT